MKQETVKVNMNIAKSVLTKIDDYAEKMGLNRSATITMIASSYFNQLESVDQMGKAIELFKMTEKKP